MLKERKNTEMRKKQAKKKRTKEQKKE